MDIDWFHHRKPTRTREANYQLGIYCALTVRAFLTCEVVSSLSLNECKDVGEGTPHGVKSYIAQ